MARVQGVLIHVRLCVVGGGDDQGAGDAGKEHALCGVETGLAPDVPQEERRSSLVVLQRPWDAGLKGRRAPGGVFLAETTSWLLLIYISICSIYSQEAPRRYVPCRNPLCREVCALPKPLV